MQVRFFIDHQGQQLGPFEFKEIERRFNGQMLFPTDFVYLTDKGEWVPILEFLMVHGPKQKVVQPALQTIGASSPADDEIDFQRFASGLPALVSENSHYQVNEPQDTFTAYPPTPQISPPEVQIFKPQTTTPEFPPPLRPPRAIVERKLMEQTLNKRRLASTTEKASVGLTAVTQKHIPKAKATGSRRKSTPAKAVTKRSTPPPKPSIQTVIAKPTPTALTPPPAPSIQPAPQVIGQTQMHLHQPSPPVQTTRNIPQFPISPQLSSTYVAAPLHPKSVDTSATAVVEVQPPRATRLHLQVIGEARVGEMIDIYVHAIAESGALDQSFNDLVHLGCDRPVGGLAPLQFKDGIARLRVLCLTPGTHQFYLSLDPITALNRLQESRGHRIDLI